ncbi:hypothetical protein [Leptolyngbya ohadii]|uniref:hypothetical protein n=1 Tax=Leptolyngbya ohadii TaxID=1962290 RepID=UPI0015C67BE7|nr:hypothetical protein [Leptolyngbya ohadii]
MRKPFQDTELLEKIADYLNVQYRYAELDEKPLIQANAAFNAVATLRTLPFDQLSQLHQATLELDNAQLTQLVAQIAPDQPILAKLLMEKIENFELQQIFDWLQAAMQDNEP